MYAYNYCYQELDGNIANISYYGFSGLNAVICFASASTYNNQTNISTDSQFKSLHYIIGEDPYYPNSAVDSRFSQVLFSPYFVTTKNCVVDSSGATGWTNLTFNLSNTYDNMRTILLYTRNNIVVREKQGFLCSTNTTEARTTIPDTKSLLRTAYNNFINSNPPALVKVFQFGRIFKYFGYGAVFEQANLSYYQNPPLDTRSPHDLTRRGGIRNKCSLSSCKGHSFTDRRTKTTSDIHDYVYLSSAIQTIAQNALNNLDNAP